MTPAQLQTLKAAVLASVDPAVQAAGSSRNDTELARLLNLPSTFYVWRSTVLADDVADAILWDRLTPIDPPDGTAPPEIAGRPFRVQYRSPIARSQKAVDVAAMDRYEAALVQEVAGTGKMELLDNYGWDRATRKRAELLGVPAELMVDADVVDESRAQRAQQQQAQQAQQMLASVVRDAKGNISGLAAPA